MLDSPTPIIARPTNAAVSPSLKLKASVPAADSSAVAPSTSRTGTRLIRIPSTSWLTA